MKTIKKLVVEFKTLETFTDKFDNEQKCRAYLAKKRWGDTPVCPYCGCITVYNKKDGRYICSHCKRTFSVLVGTIFQSTNLPLMLWFRAIHMLVNNKQGISSCQLARELKVTQKTAWFMLQKIRVLLRDENDTFPDKVEGIIVPAGTGQNGPPYVRVIDHPLRLHPSIERFVRPQSRIYSDIIFNYQTLSESEWERYHSEDSPGIDPATGLNGAPKGVTDPLWTPLKRMIMGVYHYVSAALFHRYVFEALFRRRTCRYSDAARVDKVMERIGKVVPYYVVRPKASKKVA